jgi:outer membrane lipoprotein SlyB
MRKTILAATLAAMAIPAATIPATAHADRYREYDRYGRYSEPHRIGDGDRVWRGRDGRYYCKRRNGTTGLVIGAAGGALLGREVDGGRNRATGTILGAAAGALIGREVQRSMRCR